MPINDASDSLNVIPPKLASPEHNPFAQATSSPLHRHIVSLPNFASRSQRPDIFRAKTRLSGL
jgi:hypothetical protein